MDLESWRSGDEREWMPLAGAARGLEVEVLRIDRALTRFYPALARVLGSAEVERLAREFVLGHPFYTGVEGDLGELLRVFLAAGLEGDPVRGAWLAELARLEESYTIVRRSLGVDELAGGQLLAFDHRVDELHAELIRGGPWSPPRPAEVLLAVVGGAAGPRCVELSHDEWAAAQASPALPATRRPAQRERKGPTHQSMA